jgi:hypothetical protein
LLAPLLTISLIALIGIVAGEKFHWSEVVLSGDWVECVISIPVIEIVPFAMTFWAMRRSMPGTLRIRLCRSLLLGNDLLTSSGTF